MRKRILTALCTFLGLSAQSQYSALYDVSADQFVPYEFKNMERRNVSPDCEERTTQYPVFAPNQKYADIKTANDRIKRMYIYYMSDTFVDELQKKFHQVVLNYREHFPDQLNCVNEQKVYAVNFTTMEVSIVSCHFGVVTLINTLYYTVANAPITQIQSNVYNEVIQVNLNNGSLVRNPSLILKDKQKVFTDLVKRQLDLYLEKYRNQGGVINDNPELIRERTDDGYEVDGPVREEEYYEETGTSTDITERETELGIQLPVTFNLVIDAVSVNPQRTGIDSAVNLIRYSDLLIYWKNYSLFVRVSPYADMAAYLPNNIIEVDFSWKEVNDYVVNSPEALFKNAPQLTKEQIASLIGKHLIENKVPFFNNDPDRVKGIRKMKVREEYQQGGNPTNENIFRVLSYDDSGRLSSLAYYHNRDTTPVSKIAYMYEGTSLKQIIYYDQSGNVTNVASGMGLSITAKENGYFLMQDNSNSYSDYNPYGTMEYKVYVLAGRLIIEPQYQVNLSEENYSSNSFARVIHFNAERKTSDFSLHYQSSIEAEMTRDGIIPIINRYYYSSSGQPLKTDESLADYNDAGQLIYISNQGSNNFDEYDFDKEGRISEIRQRNYDGVYQITTFTYSGNAYYPSTAVLYSPAQLRLVKYTFEAE